MVKLLQGLKHRRGDVWVKQLEAFSRNHQILRCVAGLWVSVWAVIEGFSGGFVVFVTADWTSASSVHRPQVEIGLQLSFLTVPAQ